MNCCWFLRLPSWLGWPLGRYLAAVMRGESMWADRLFGWVENPIYHLLGVNPTQGMGWKSYMRAFLFSNLLLAVPVWLILMNQAWLPLNPDNAPNMRWDLALHTMISFPDQYQSTALFGAGSAFLI